jgi:hypothetical protein
MMPVIIISEKPTASICITQKTTMHLSGPSHNSCVATDQRSIRRINGEEEKPVSEQKTYLNVTLCTTDSAWTWCLQQ